MRVVASRGRGGSWCRGPSDKQALGWPPGSGLSAAVKHISADIEGSTVVHIWPASVHADNRTKLRQAWPHVHKGGLQSSARSPQSLASSSQEFYFGLRLSGTFQKCEASLTFFYLKKMTLIFLRCNKHQKGLLILRRCRVISSMARALFSNKTQTRETKGIFQNLRSTDWQSPDRHIKHYFPKQ